MADAAQDDGGFARVAVVAADAALLHAAREAVLSLGGHEPLLLGSDRALLDAVVSHLGPFGHLLIEVGGPLDPELLDALAEASPGAAVAILPVGFGAASIRALLRDGRSGARRHATGPLRPGGLMLRYQPILSLRDRRMVMVEALSRWASEEPLALAPAQFVPALERLGFGRLLAAAVTRVATRDIASLPWPVKVSVNLAVAEFERRDVVAWLARHSRHARLPPRRLCVELTETSPVVDTARLTRALERLRAAGHDVVLDDFVLDDPRRRLLHLPFSGVKLDRSFTRLAPVAARARRQIRELCERGLTVTAEGIASRTELDVLRALGVQHGQGFWLARPLPLQALRAWARRRAVQPWKARV